jgi:hypothetical protein
MTEKNEPEKKILTRDDIRNKGWDFIAVVHGEVASKSNSRRIVKFGKKTAIIKGPKALSFAAAWKEQVTPLENLIDVDCAIRVDAWYSSRRPDLNCVELVKDLCQGYAYKNDRLIKVELGVWNLDRQYPRVQVAVKKLPWHGLENHTRHLSMGEIFHDEFVVKDGEVE